MLTIRKENNKILEGAMTLTIATVVVKILGAIYKIPISHVLGEEGMGHFNSAYTVYSFFYLLCTAGVPKAIMILCGELENEGKEKITVIKSSISFFVWLGISIAISFSLLSRLLSNLIGNPDSYISMIFIAPSILFSATSGVYRGYFSSKVEFFRVSIAQVIEGASRLIFGLLLALFASRTYTSLGVISAFALLGTSIGSLLSLIYLSHSAKLDISKYKNGQKVSIDEKVRLVKRIVYIALPIAAGAIIMSITNIIDLGIVMNRLKSLGFSSSTTTSLYGNYTTLATPIFNTIISLFVPLTVAFMPALIKASSNAEEFNRTLLEEMNISSFVFIPLTIGICVYSDEILKLLFNDKWVFLGSRLLTYLMISIFFIIPLYIINCALEALGNVKATMISMLVGGVFKVISGFVLIGNRNFGIFGAPISTIIFYSAALITSVAISIKQTKISLPFLKSMASPLINSFISIYTIYAFYLYTSTKTNWIVSFIISVVLTIVLYFVLNLIEGNFKKDIYLKLKGNPVKGISLYK
jgi:stage V sporulation protein B